MSEKTIGIEARAPIIDKERAQVFSFDAMDKQWGLLTEATRREFISNSETRKALLQFCKTPITEKLPDNFLQVISTFDKRVAKLVDRYKSNIKAYFELPAVPEDQIQPDIRHAPSLTTPKEIMDMLKEMYGDDESQYEGTIKRYIDSGTFLRGITEDERQMITKRYKYARDVKLLALGAEIVDCGNIIQNENGEAVLPSGIKIAINLEHDVQRNDLFSPHLWERRRQLKDRVYEIEVNGRKYILKEKKTTKHTDTKKGGHKEGGLSSEEFETAKFFKEHGIANKDGIHVDWEQPIGYVTYPDGFSFVVFEYEEGLIKSDDVIDQVSQKIIEHKEQFLEEYQLITKLAKKYVDETKNYKQGGKLKVISRVLGRYQDNSQELSFEEFSRVKALRIERQAREFMKETIILNGYENSDFDGYSYRVVDGDKLEVEIVGFDFEYYSKMSPDMIDERLEDSRQFKRDWESKHSIGFALWNDTLKVTKMQCAAYFAMLEVEGNLNKDA